MAQTIKSDDEPILRWLRLLGWGTAGLLLLAPLVAMQIAPDSGVNWTVGDFIFAAFLLGGVGLAAELAVRISTSWTYRIGAALGLAAGFFLLWANAAVGYIGDDNPLNIVFVGVVALAFVGSLVARFRPRGMAVAMAAAGIAHFIAGAIGFPQDPITGPVTLVFTAMWLTSAWLFRNAAREGQCK
jgi:hypothetical protein